MTRKVNRWYQATDLNSLVKINSFNVMKFGTSRLVFFCSSVHVEI